MLKLFPTIFLKNGPNLGVHKLEIEGPTEPVEDETDRTRKRLKDNFLAGTAALNGRAKIEAVLKNFLSKIFRRPATPIQIKKYADLVEKHAAEKGDSLDHGYHLAIRTALISPEFLYRESNPGELDHYDLASRLAYFLTNSPPDNRLLDAAEKGFLTDPEILTSHARRILESNASGEFIRTFTEQWLGARKLPGIMPDPRTHQCFPLQTSKT